MSVNRPFAGKCHNSSITAAIILVAVFFALTVTSGELSAADAGIHPAYSVDISGDLAVIGASWEDGYSGAAYVLRRDGADWVIEQRLEPSDLGPYDHFGSSVSIDGDRIIVTSPWHDLQRGASYVFVRDRGRWIQDRKIPAREEAVAGKLAANMALTGGPPEQDVLNAEAEALIGALESETGSTPPLAAPAALVAPSWVSATDGTYEDRVEITWEDTGQEAILYKVLRNDTLIAFVARDVFLFSDETGTLAQTAQYCVVVTDMVAEETTPVCDDGTRILFVPTSFTASDGQYTDGVHLSWIDMSSINDGYIIYRDSVPIDTVGANATSFIDDTAVQGRYPYEYGIKAYVDGGFESATATDSGWCGEILPPQNVSASDGQYLDRVIVTWLDQAPDATLYRIYRRGTLIDSTGVGIETYIDSTVVFGVLYDYCVEAVGAGGIVSIRICDDGNAGLATPGSVSASDSTFDDRVQITWEDLSDYEDGYEIVRDSYVSSGIGKNGTRPIVTASIDSVVVGTVGAGVEVFDDMTAEPGGMYVYYVRAFSTEGGVSLYGEDIGTRSVVLAPTVVQATDGDYEDRAYITWQSASATAVGFMVFRDGMLITSVEESQKYYDDTGGVAGQDYEYSVQAFTLMGDTSMSDLDDGRRELLSPAPVFAGDNTYEDRVIVSWSDNSAVEDGYRVYRRAVADIDSVLIATTDPNRTSHIDYLGTSAVTYAYSVAAYDTTSAGTDGESSAVQDEGGRLLIAPTSVNATDDTYEDRVEITWDDNSNAEDGYYIYRDAALIDSTADNYTSYTDYSPLLGTQHLYSIAAFDAIGPSAASTDSGSVDILAPASVNASDFYEHGIELTWIDQSEIEEGYRIFRSGEIVDSITESQGYSFLDHSKILAMGTWESTPSIPSADDVVVQGDFAYVWYNNECQMAVIDVSDPSSPTLTGSCYIDIPMFALERMGMCVSGSHVYIANRDYGLYVIDISNPSDPVPAGPLYDPLWLPYSYTDVAVDSSRNLAYVLDLDIQGGGCELEVWDISDPVNPVLDHGSMTPLAPWTDRVFVDGGVIYVSSPSGPAMQSYMYLGPGALVPGGTYDQFGTGARDIFVSGYYAYIVRDNLFEVINHGQGPSTRLWHIPEAVGDHVSVAGGRAFVTGDELSVFDVSDPYDPQVLGSFDLPGSTILGVDAVGDTVYVAAADSGLHVISEFDFMVEGETYDYCVQAYSGDLLSDQRCDAGTITGSWIAPDVSGAVAATDGTEDSRVRITWTDSYTGEDGFLIYRDGVLHDENVGPETEFYNDSGALRGRTYYYCVKVVQSPGDTSSVGCDFGWRPPNGAIAGRVTTRGGAGVADISVYIEPALAYSLLFDGYAGAVRALDSETFDFAVSSDFTIEAWIRYTGGAGDSDESIISKGYSANSYPFEIHTAGGSGYPGRLVFAMSDGSQTVSVESDSIDLNDNEWHHVAFVHDAGLNELSLYIDQSFNASASSAGLVDITNADQLYFGTGRSGPFKGQVDEVRIWNTARTDVQIRDAMDRPLEGDESGLLGYWNFDEGQGPAATDLAGDAQYGILDIGAYWVSDAAPVNGGARTDIEGNYIHTGLRFEDGDTLYIRPSEGERQFQPAFKSVVLSEQSPSVNEISFVEISSYTISGEILFAGTGCPVPNARVLLDGNALGVTDKNGKFAVVADNGEHTLAAELEGHTFLPADTILIVDSDVSADFVNTTMHTLSGSAGGGCGRYIGDLTVTFESQNGCLLEIASVDSASASYEISLPPQVYLVSAEVDPGSIPSGLSPSDVSDFFQDLGIREVDLTAASDTTLDFIYRPDLIVAIGGFEDYVPVCGQLSVDGDTLPSGLPVVPQFEYVTLTITVDEDYGPGGTCPLDTGSVTIYDEIFDREDIAVTVPVSNGIAEYTTFASTPSLIVGRMDGQGNNRSYQKAITVYASAEGVTMDPVTEWVLVTGHMAQEGFEFVTFAGSVQPNYILRDPPGDNSYAYLNNGYKSCAVEDYDMMTWKTGRGISLDIKWGLQKSFFIGLGAGTSENIEIRQTSQVNLSGERTSTTDSKTEVCLSFNEKFSTSNSELFIGETGDIFVGTGTNYIFAEVALIEVEGCDVTRSTSIGVQPEGFHTVFAYTEQYITDVLIPDLDTKVAYYIDADEPDSADVFLDALNAWQSMLDLNEGFKRDAQTTENRSFSSGADYDYSYSEETTTSYTKTVTLTGSLGSDTGLQSNLFGNTYKLTLSKSNSISGVVDLTDTTGTSIQTVGYVLSDNDIGDYFTVDVKNDDTYPSPVFDVLAGASSCPYEAWPDTSDLARMTPRDGTALLIDPVIALNVPADELAVFDLTLVNESGTAESRWYNLQVYPGSNPDAAVIRADGAFINSSGMAYFLEPGVAHQVTITVQRGPVSYSYDSLKVMLYPPCEFAIWQKHGGLQRTAFKTFNVHFVPPCSEIAISGPADGWMYDGAMQTAGDSMMIMLSGYDKDFGDIGEGLNIDYAGAKYRRLGSGDEGPDEWAVCGAVIMYADLPEDNVTMKWLPPASLEDGAYELRAFTHCDNGEGYSETVVGTIDRHSPVVFGTPEPSDGILSFGEDISITFNEKLDSLSIDEGDITLMYLDGPDADSLIAFTAVCNGSTIIIRPGEDPGEIEGRRIRASVGGLTDRIGNPLETAVVWEFDCRLSQFAWSDADLVLEGALGNPGKLMGELVNGTGESVDFSFTSLPSWITGVIPSSGTILPGETEVIELVIQTDLAAGIYHDEVRVEATDGSNVSTAVLTIDLTIECQPPAWAVNPNSFEHSMAVVAKLDIEGVKSSDRADMVGAYVGGELRGFASIDSVHVYDSDTGFDYSWLAFLTVYGNRPSGETVRFAVWDGSECRLYSATEESHPFLADGQAGTPDAPVTLTATDVIGGEVVAIEVQEGWNWISTNVWTPDMSVTKILADLNLASGDLIKSQTAFSQFIDDPDPEVDPAWVPAFDLDNVSGYLLNLAQAGTIIHSGSIVSVDSIIPVAQGWNWIGYLPTGAMAVDLALDDLDVGGQNLLIDNDIIKGQDGFAQYLDGEWYGTLAEMDPGRGYKLYLANAGVTGFNYPVYVGSPAEPQVTVASAEAGEEAPGSGPAVAAVDQVESAPDWSVNHYAYQFNMTMTAVLRVDGLESADGRDIVGAFVDGECRGIAKPEYIGGIRRYEAFLMIHSNEPSGETVEFRVFDADEGTICGVTEQVDCSADAVLGTVTQPFVLSAVSGEEEEDGGVPKAYALGQNVPNPFNPSTTIYYDVPSGGGNVSLRVYDVSGRLVRTLVDGHDTEGSKSVSWDGTGDRGQSVASGIYFYRMTAQGFTETKKMVLLR